MKFIYKLLALLLVIFIMAGCGAAETSDTDGNTKNLPDREKETRAESRAARGEPSSKDSPDVQASPSSKPRKNKGKQKKGKPDYDLTSMNKDMVYATVYQMIAYPENYVGKTIRMKGLYYAGYYEATKHYYHYCLIQDALACCAQGIEFVWEDGRHIYPDEYPKENAEIVVQGVFETYREENNPRLSCCLKNASLKVKK